MNALKSLWRILTLSCEEASHIASDDRDRSLTRFERTALKAHLFSCGNCKRFRRQLQMIHKAAAEVPDLPEDAKQRIQAKLDQEP